MSGWVKALASIYQAGNGDWAAIEQGIRNTWSREMRYRPGHANGFVDEVRKAATVDSGDQYSDEQIQTMLEEVEYHRELGKRYVGMDKHERILRRRGLLE
jgi:hypothetical protein